MALQLMDINCSRIESKLQEGYFLGFFGCGDSIISRIQNEKLIASSEGETIDVVLKKTERQLSDKLQYFPPLRKTLNDSSLDKFIKKGGKLYVKAKFNVYTGFLIANSERLIAEKKALNLLDLVATLEIVATKYF